MDLTRSEFSNPMTQQSGFGPRDGGTILFNFYSLQRRKFWLYWTPRKNMVGFGYYIDADYNNPESFKCETYMFNSSDDWEAMSV